MRSIIRKLVLGLLVFSVAAVIGSAVIEPQFALAEGLTADQLRALQLRAGAGDDTTDLTAGAPTKPVVQTYQPVSPNGGGAPGSRLEMLYTQRAGRTLVQFGYDFLGVPAAVSIAQSGAVQDSYVLGSGDEIVVVFRGQENASYRQRLDSSGRVILPKLNPIQAAGRTLADFRRELEAQVAQAFISTHVFVSLGEVHQLSVLVTGEVRAPGMRIVSALASPLDAILLSGGIAKTGSLRNIKLIRAGTTTTIDLYSVIAQGGAANMGALRDGDRIFVPTLGPTVAVAGYVRRPGIYELPAGSQGIAAQSLARLAGGVEIAGAYNISKTVLDRDGTNRLINFPATGIIRSGEIMFIDTKTSQGLDRVLLDGSVALVGARPLSTSRTVGEMLNAPGALNLDAYKAFAILIRHDVRTNSTTLIPISLIHALADPNDLRLQSDDTVYVFTAAEIRGLTTLATYELNSPYQPETAHHPATGMGDDKDNATGPAASTVTAVTAGAYDPRYTPDYLTGTSGAGGTAPPAPGGAAGADGTPAAPPGGTGHALADSATAAAISQADTLGRSATGLNNTLLVPPPETPSNIVARLSSYLKVPPQALVRTVANNIVWVLDSVRLPGPYAAAPGTTMADIVNIAGGPMQDADLSSIEVTSTIIDQRLGTSNTTRNNYDATGTQLASISVQPRDVIRLRPVYQDRDYGTISVTGQVRYPGVFDITRGERLSSVLQRSGGLTDVAYPYGAIYTRKSAAVAEREGNARVALEIESQLGSLASPQSASASQINPAGISFLSTLAQHIREAPALGRISITADPVVLATHPELDPLLEPGDTLYIPKRPSSVTVSGEVLNAGAFQFRPQASVSEYISLAGGMNQNANSSLTYIIMPDGSAVPYRSNWLSFDNGGHIPPGSTIVVPRDLRPFDWLSFFKDITQIMSQLSVSAASLSVLNKN